MRPPSRRQLLTLGPTIAVLLLLALPVADFGPHPAYLLHRLLPLESGPAGVVGLHYSTDEEEVGLPLGHTAECVDSSRRRSCRYIVRLHLPGPSSEGVSTPMLWLERTRGGPDVNRIDVVDAAAVPSGLDTSLLLPTEQGDVVALPGERDADGWYSVRAAWRADTGRWQLHRVDPAGLRAYDPDHRPTGPLPPRPALYAALVEGPLQDPTDIKRPSIAPAATDWGRRGFGVTHLYDVRDGKDVLVTTAHATVGVTDVAIVPHAGDVRLLYGLVAGGNLRGDLVGLLSTTPQGSPDVVRHAWHLTSHGQLEPVPVDGLTCRRNPPGALGAGLCATSYDNLVALHGTP